MWFHLMIKDPTFENKNDKISGEIEFIEIEMQICKDFGPIVMQKIWSSYTFWSRSGILTIKVKSAGSDF